MTKRISVLEKQKYSQKSPAETYLDLITYTFVTLPLLDTKESEKVNVLSGNIANLSKKRFFLISKEVVRNSS